jgi:hypothetical protein
VSQLDAIQRDKRLTDREAVRVEREKIAALDVPFNELNDMADLVARAALLAAGYHQHKRGAWRKRREQRDQAT